MASPPQGMTSETPNNKHVLESNIEAHRITSQEEQVVRFIADVFVFSANTELSKKEKKEPRD